MCDLEAMNQRYPWWTQMRTGEQNIRIDEQSLIAPDARLDGSQGEITIGKRCEIHPGAMLMPYGGFIRVGDFCSVNPYCMIYGHGGLTIGNGVRIATGTVIIPSNHDISNPEVMIKDLACVNEGITIEDDVWIGARCTILDGVCIGAHSVIAAGAVVNKVVEPYSIVGGVPAKVIRRRV